MSQPINEKAVNIRPDNEVPVHDEILDLESTLPNDEESLKFIGSNPKGDCVEQWNISEPPSSFFSSNSDILMLDTDNTIREENTDSNTGYGETDEAYSQSMSSLLLNLNGFNSQESRRNNLSGLGLFKRSSSVYTKEIIITEVTGSNSSRIQTSTIEHALNCKGKTHRILAKLVDVFPKELSKIKLTDTYGITLVLKDKSGYTLNAKITAPVDKHYFFDFFVCETTSQETTIIQIGALFEYIIGRIGIFKDYVIHEEEIPENEFLLDLCILSTENGNSFQVFNTRFTNVFMVCFCSHLLTNNEDILANK